MLKPTIAQWTDEEHLMLLTSWCRAGLTYEQIAGNIGINRSSLLRWRNASPKLMEALAKSKEMADACVENALFKSALGFEYQEQVVTNKGEVVWITKFERPAISAQIFYLKNRKPKFWSDRREIKHAGLGDHDITVKWGGDTLESGD